MDDYVRMKQMLTDLRQEILNYTNSNFEQQDLMNHFIKVKEHDESTYELLVLIYNEFQMTTKHNKKQFVLMLDKALQIKTETINKMILENKKNSTWSNKLYAALTWKNTVRLLGVWLFIITVMFGIYEIDKDAYSAISKDANEFVEDVQETIKGK